MISLREAKLTIMRTECKDFLREGLYCSEPILSLEEERLIDNYFIYASNYDGSIVTKPLIRFGIDSELEGVKYIMNHLPEENGYPISNVKAKLINEKDIYEKYEELYPCIRSFAFVEKCTLEQKEQLKEYINILHDLSGSELWKIYKKIGAPFFDWITEQNIDEIV